MPNAYLVHHDESIYPDPYTFQPERFLDVLTDFVDSTEPAELDARGWRELLKTS